jgi:hypothetical protein
VAGGVFYNAVRLHTNGGDGLHIPSFIAPSIIIIIIILTLPAQASQWATREGYFMQHLNTHKQQLRALSLQIIIHRTHAPVHKQSHDLTVTTTH